MNTHAFRNAGIISQDDDTYLISFQVEGNAHNAVLKFYQFLGTNVGQACDLGNTITGFFDNTNFFDFVLCLECSDLLL
ncbi:hypothetical protein SDC9_161606 [bioreactor metagenome]|uniref:Uncharacterized protein n=1 Tax=bioreactor metagenome TaxID=1076179 RepID=A0A645FJY5_9ZZZZ